MNKPVYLDYAATTPVDPRVMEKICECLTMDGCFGNPASRSHRYGWQAEEIVDIARNQVADLIVADAREIIWTSGATEANNLAIKGLAQKRLSGQSSGHIVTSAIEHKAVLDPCAELEKQGFAVSYVSPNQQGIITPQAVQAAIREDTFLISLMHVNNELGTIQPIEAIAQLAKKADILMHVDAAQSVGKLSINLKKLDVDFMSFSGHKIYAPKGIGCLFARKNQQHKLYPQIHGGGHERSLRSGTLATHQIAAIGLAFELAENNLAEEYKSIQAKKMQFVDAMQSIDGVVINGDIQQTIAGIVNLGFQALDRSIDSEMLLMAFKDIAVSSGSACTSAAVEPSHVLKALGLDDHQAHACLRFSFGRFTTDEDIQTAISTVKQGLQKLTSLQ